MKSLSKSTMPAPPQAASSQAASLLDGAQVPEGVKYLDQTQLAALTAAFEDWYKSTRGEATRRARGRVWCLFLILRYTGARLQETLDLDDRTDVDLARAVVRFRGAEHGDGDAPGDAGQNAREVELPREAAQELAAYLEDPAQAEGRGAVFRMDQGHVRRKFQEVGERAGLPRELANPTALRRSRAIELLQGGMPLPIVQQVLGQGTANLAASLLEFSDEATRRILGEHLRRENARRMSARNTFFGQVARIRSGDIQSEVELTTLGGYPVYAVITNGSVRSMQLRPGRYATAIVKAPWVALARGDASPQSSAANRFAGVVRQVQAGDMCTEVVAELADGLQVCAIITNDSAAALELALGARLWVMFDAFAAILLAD
ncbi:TOBE domain-containing protein [Megalodesulfovibrio paquesii]